MSQEEKTGKRDLKYSRWHRSPECGGVLPHWCYTINLDYVEYRNGKIVAFIEAAESGIDLNSNYLFNNKGFEIKVLCQLTELTKIPSYIVIHNNDLSMFKVYYELPSNKSTILSSDLYKDWIKNIDKRRCPVI